MRSIERQLTLWLLGGSVLLTALGGAAVYVAVRSALYAQFDAGLRVKALVVITSTEQRRDRIKVQFSDRFLREFDDEVATDFFQVWALGGGGNSERSDSLGGHTLPQRFGTIEAPEYWNLPLPGSGIPGRAIGMEFLPRLHSSDARAGVAQLKGGTVVAGSRRELDAMLHRVRWILIAAGAALILTTSAVVPLALRPALRPLRRLGDQVEQMNATTLGCRFPVETLPVELRPISERLNELMGRLETSFEREQRFSADLAHELLTPLAELRVTFESAVKWPDTAGPRTFQQALEILLRMEKLVTRLLELCRAEHGRMNAHVRPAPLANLLRALWTPFASNAEAKSLRVTLEGPEALEVATDPELLGILVRNLYANAVEYSPAGGKVSIAWSADATGYRVRVTNPAPQLSADDVARMFDRFWRKDPARSDSHHSGLGLSVARELAAVLNGQLTGRLSDEGLFSAEFVAGLPVAGSLRAAAMSQAAAKAS